jgi:hypothetical protein
MIDARARGLANIYAAMATVFVGLLYWAWVGANMEFHVPYVHMTPNENLMPYFLCVVCGMLLSARDASRRLASRFHLPDLGGPARLAFRQVLLIAMLLFAMMFATQDHSISRLFLGEFLVLSWIFLVFLNAFVPRRLARFVFQKGHRLPTVFIGKPGSFAKVREWIASKEHLGIHTVGFISSESPPSDPSDLRFHGLAPCPTSPRSLRRARSAR